jgi:hypothetical protein
VTDLVGPPALPGAEDGGKPTIDTNPGDMDILCPMQEMRHTRPHIIVQSSAVLLS